MVAGAVRSSAPLRAVERLAGGRDLAGTLELGGLVVAGRVLAEELAEGVAAAGYPPLGKRDFYLPGDHQRP